ncbi:hypothetical protein OHC33_010975 [Knufia fluminis]|uniref:Uncharacterized protein n=1 Tax=Knufia fluminis TaxID=191047 RepID=A0AAN8I368_9EURO|nr:hypothetical protein OHC33_010975 [Knufia fluminis]
MSMIKESTWWKTFKQTYPGFGGFLLLRYAPRRMADADKKAGKTWVYTSDQTLSLCGAPIFFSVNKLGLDARCAPRQATLGNIIYLDGRPFGLTVAHPLVNQPHDDQTTSHGCQSDPVFYMDDSDDSSSSFSSSPSNSTEPSVGHAGHVLQPVHDGGQAPSIPLEGRPRLLGELVYSSRGQPDDDVDWALIVMTQDTEVSSGQSIATIGTYTNNKREPVAIKPPTFIADSAGGPIAVFTTGKERSLIQGVLGPNKALICLPGSRQHLLLQHLLLPEKLSLGACGKWVFDHQGNWYGHVVAGMPGTKVAYVAPAAGIVDSIRLTTRMTSLSLESPQPGFPVEKIKPSSTSMRHAINAPALSKRQSPAEQKPRIKALRPDRTSVLDRVYNLDASSNAQRARYSNALQAASAGGHEKVVQILVEQGADVNTQGGHFGNALQAASARGHEKVVQMLLERGADVNAQAGYFGNALYAASEGGHEKAVQILVDKGADVNAQGGHKTKLGADHPSMLSSMADLASTYSNQGRWEEAEQLEVQVLEARKTKLGADHPDTLTSTNNLALTYKQQGRWQEAEQLQVQVLEMRKTKLGVDHPDTLKSITNLASTYWNQGRLEEAEQLQVQELEMSKTKLGLDHPDTLLSMDNLALTYSSQERWAEAEQLQVQVVEIFETKLGTDHPNTLTSMNNLALTYSDQGRWAEAEQLQVQVLEIQKTKLGVDHPSMLTSMRNLAFTWKDLGRDEEAVQLMRECVQRQIHVLGATHPHAISSRETLAAWEAKDLTRSTGLSTDEAAN